MTMTRCCLFILASSCGLLACAGGGEGEIEVRAWGEGFIEEGIPAAELVDGWAISFTRFEVELRDVSVAGVEVGDTQTLDLTQASEGRGQLVGRATAPTGEYEDGRYTIAQAIVEGEASQGESTKSFSWTFSEAVAYADCEAVTEIPRDGVGEFQITVHADHLFYDSLASEEPGLAFGPLAAADADDDGVITQAELEAAGLGAYDPGNFDVDNLWDFLVAQAGTMGHVNGELHCSPQS